MLRVVLCILALGIDTTVAFQAPRRLTTGWSRPMELRESVNDLSSPPQVEEQGTPEPEPEPAPKKRTLEDDLPQLSLESELTKEVRPVPGPGLQISRRRRVVLGSDRPFHCRRWSVRTRQRASRVSE